MSLKKAIEFFALREAWLGEGGKPVSHEQAQARADVCLQCPYNDASKKTYEIFAAKVASIVRRQIELKNSLKLFVDGEDRLHVCSACLCVLRLKVHAPLKFIVEHTDTSGQPDYCWIAREMKQQKQTKE